MPFTKFFLGDWGKGEMAYWIKYLVLTSKSYEFGSSEPMSATCSPSSQGGAKGEPYGMLAILYLPSSASSGFNWKTPPQWIRWRAIKEKPSANLGPPTHSCTHANEYTCATHTIKHTYIHEDHKHIYMKKKQYLKNLSVNQFKWKYHHRLLVCKYSVYWPTLILFYFKRGVQPNFNSAFLNAINTFLKSKVGRNICYDSQR